MEITKKNELKKLLSQDLSVISFLVAVVLFASSMWIANTLLGKIGIYIPYCICHDLLHLYCPVCGCTRAGLALLRLDFAESLAANPLVIIFAVGFIIYNIMSFCLIIYGKKIPHLKHFGIILGILLAVFAIMRNILMIFFDFDTLGELSYFWQSVKGVY